METTHKTEARINHTKEANHKLTLNKGNFRQLSNHRHTILDQINSSTSIKYYSNWFIYLDMFIIMSYVNTCNHVHRINNTSGSIKIK